MMKSSLTRFQYMNAYATVLEWEIKLLFSL